MFSQTDDHTKLNGIETDAVADQTNAEIKTAYEANANTNEFSAAVSKSTQAVYRNSSATVQPDC